MSTMTPAQFAAECRSVAAAADRAVSAVVKRGANNVKTTARNTADSSNAGKAAAVYHINFDMDGELAAEIGYDKPAGSLGTMLEYGSAGNTPGNDLGMALEREAPNMDKFIADAVERLWR